MNPTKGQRNSLGKVQGPESKRAPATLVPHSWCDEDLGGREEHAVRDEEGNQGRGQTTQGLTSNGEPLRHKPHKQGVAGSYWNPRKVLLASKWRTDCRG